MSPRPRREWFVDRAPLNASLEFVFYKSYFLSRQLKYLAFAIGKVAACDGIENHGALKPLDRRRTVRPLVIEWSYK
jgi:hypothetical protein